MNGLGYYTRLGLMRREVGSSNPLRTLCAADAPAPADLAGLEQRQRRSRAEPIGSSTSSIEGGGRRGEVAGREVGARLGKGEGWEGTRRGETQRRASNGRLSRQTAEASAPEAPLPRADG